MKNRKYRIRSPLHSMFYILHFAEQIARLGDSDTREMGEYTLIAGEITDFLSAAFTSLA